MKGEYYDNSQSKYSEMWVITFTNDRDGSYDDCLTMSALYVEIDNNDEYDE